LRNTHCPGVRIIPYMDDFLFLGDSYEDTFHWRDHLEAMLKTLGL
jgi:hypothetical protein